MRKLIVSAFAAGLAVSAAPPTFTKDIAPIFHKRCVGCHRPKDIAPMSLLDYKSARPWAKAIKASVTTRKMPPWFADPHYGQFSNDARLSTEEIETIRAWVDAGAPEGNPKVLPVPPKMVEGWALGQPDLIIDIGEEYRVTPGEDAYEHFTVSTNLKEGVWIRAAEFRPGNRQVVHHAHVHVIPPEGSRRPAGALSTKNMPPLSQFLLREGKLSRIRMDAPVWNDGCAPNTPDLPYLSGAQDGAFASFLPGRPPDVFPDGTAKWIPAGSKVEFVIHYANSTTKQTDRSSIGLYFAPAPPEKVLRRMDLRNFFMQIPAGEANHEVRRCYTFEKDKLLLSFTPHFHYRGKDATYEVVHPDGRRETLLKVPNYDFNWQLVYRLRDPVLIKKDSRMIVTVHFDNSVNNPANPDPKQVIRWGDKTEEEMMTSWIEYLDADSSRTARARD